MAKGSWTATAVSSEIVPADEHREHLLVQKLNATAVYLGIGEAAESGKGVGLLTEGATLHLHGAAARLAVNAIGNGGTGTYQDGDLLLTLGQWVA